MSSGAGEARWVGALAAASAQLTGGGRMPSGAVEAPVAGCAGNGFPPRRTNRRRCGTRPQSGAFAPAFGACMVALLGRRCSVRGAGAEGLHSEHLP